MVFDSDPKRFEKPDPVPFRNKQFRNYKTAHRIIRDRRKKRKNFSFQKNSIYTWEKLTNGLKRRMDA